MDYLFGDKSYPVVARPEDILGELHRDGTKAVIFRNAAQWAQDKPVYKTGIEIPKDAEHGKRYWSDPAQGEHGRIITGEIAHTHTVGVSEILTESQAAHINITPEAMLLLERRVEEYRALFLSVQTQYKGFKQGDELYTRLLFAPRGGQGRSPMMHVDDVDLTGHFTVKGATLRLENGLVSDTAWDAMNRELMRALPKDIQAQRENWLTSITADNYEEFSSAHLGDFVIMKGGKGKDLKTEEARRNTCVHVSSPYIVQDGQAACLFYAKDPSTSLE